MGADQNIESVAGVLIVDALSDDLAITWASPGFELLTGYGAIEVLGRNARLLQGPDTDPRAISTIRQALADGTDCYLTVLNYRADGSPFWNELSISPQRDKHGTVVRWIAAMRDVSDRMRLQQQPQDTPDFDQLTGLPGHSALYDEMRAALHRARVHDREAALLLIDIEDFAQVNDAHGRDVGDAILRAAADRLRGLVRPGDTLARTNSDEFALLLADVPSRASEVAAELALRLDAALREPFGSDSLKIELRANTGIAVFPGALTAPELLTQATMAADLALSQGRPYVIFQAKPARMLVNADEAFGPASYVDELRSILAAGQITCLLQPVMDITGEAPEVAGYEAFARGPEGSALHEPQRLVATAEAAGLLAELDWACRAAALHAAADQGLPEGTTLFVNTTAATIGDPAPADHRSSSELSGRYDLVLDLPVAELERDAVATLRAAARWQALGGRLAIDDLGAGTRGLGLLPLLDPDVVKLDLSRISGHAPSEQARLATAVTAYAERTGGQVVAEGVESPNGLTTAAALGARFAQGRLFEAGAEPNAPLGGVPHRPPGLTTPPVGATGPFTRQAHESVSEHDPQTPFEMLTAGRTPERLPQAALEAAMTLAEQRAQHGDGVVVLSVLPTPTLLDEERSARMRSIARHSPLVALFGDELGSEPVAEASGVQLAPGDRLIGSWCLVVLGTGLAIALAAEQQPEGDYLVARSTDPNLVVAAARTLLPRLTADSLRS